MRISERRKTAIAAFQPDSTPYFLRLPASSAMLSDGPATRKEGIHARPRLPSPQRPRSHPGQSSVNVGPGLHRSPHRAWASPASHPGICSICRALRLLARVRTSGHRESYPGCHPLVPSRPSPRLPLPRAGADHLEACPRRPEPSAAPPRRTDSATPTHLCPESGRGSARAVS